nr:hypothetical protein BaRGS_028732 [Batillaria attramentaria]
MQLLDERHLLIKYASEDVVALRVQEPNSQPSFFVVYDIETTQVVAVYENTSEELLELFENFCDMFRNASLHSQSFSSSPYLDLALFSYDDKWLSVMERPKSLGDHPIRLHFSYLM